MVSQIGRGLCVLIGISRNDRPEDCDYMWDKTIDYKNNIFLFSSVRKILNLRLFDSEDGKRWSESVTTKNYEILSVSQFTLYSHLKGNKPDFHNAMEPQKSKQFYDDFIQKLKNSYKSELIKGLHSYWLVIVILSCDLQNRWCVRGSNESQHLQRRTGDYHFGIALKDIVSQFDWFS